MGGGGLLVHPPPRTAKMGMAGRMIGIYKRGWRTEGMECRERTEEDGGGAFVFAAPDLTK